jgi:pyridoxal phosphate-dependent aminotransferase EpsN
MTKKKILLSSPHMSGEEINYINEAFEINWVAPLGPHLDLFEKKLSEFCTMHEAVGMSSGTAAIHIALRLLNIEQGDEILCSSATFIASANPILYEKAKPVFIDSELDTWNISPEALERAILSGIKKNKKPKAAVIVHLYGYPAKMDEISTICKKYDVAIIEDAAEALGSFYKNKACGSFSEFGILSFNGNKIITTGGGGALLLKNTELANKARFLITQARDKSLHYQHSQIGYNYRLSNILAGIGIGQMNVLKNRVESRKNIFKTYQNELSQYLEFVPDMPGFNSNRWLSAGLVKKKNYLDLINHLTDNNIETRPLWKPLHQQPLFADCEMFPHIEGKKPVCDDLFARGICLPSSSHLSSEDQNFVIAKIKEFFI